MNSEKPQFLWDWKRQLKVSIGTSEGSSYPKSKAHIKLLQLYFETDTWYLRDLPSFFLFYFRWRTVKIVLLSLSKHSSKVCWENPKSEFQIYCVDIIDDQVKNNLHSFLEQILGNTSTKSSPPWSSISGKLSRCHSPLPTARDAWPWLIAHFGYNITMCSVYTQVSPFLWLGRPFQSSGLHPRRLN